MPRDFIQVDEALEFGNKLKRMLNNAQDTLDQIRDIKREMDRNTDGTDYSDIATLFGLSRGTDTDTVVGQATYNYLSGALAELEADTNFLGMLDVMG